MNALSEFINRDSFAKHLGIEILEASDGRAKGRMDIKPCHLNSAGTLHGGAIFGFADAVFSAASNSHGTLAMAINVSISYFRAVRSGTLFAEAEEISINPKLATYLIRIMDDKQNIIALFQGTVYKKQTSLEEILGTE
ncbi:MAG: PaaI family thioesterase [Nitrospirae bacterium]|nr:PaaI family thioesterase [Nitrospirota bacterium]